MLAIRNVQTEIHVQPGQESRHVITDETYPEWGDDCPMILLSPQISLRVPCYVEGRSIVVELNAMDSCFPQPSVGFSLSAFYDGRMTRVASGYLRRQS